MIDSMLQYAHISCTYTCESRYVMLTHMLTQCHIWLPAFCLLRSESNVPTIDLESTTSTTPVLCGRQVLGRRGHIQSLGWLQRGVGAGWRDGGDCASSPRASGRR